MKQKEWKEDKNSSLLTFSNIWNNIELCESMANSSEALQVNELLSLQNLITFFHPMSFSANFKWLYLVIISLPNVNFFSKGGKKRMFLFSLFSFAFFALQNEKESQGNTQQIQIMKI